MNESYYFSHDYSSRSDEKIKKLLRKHGYLGYGLFWAIVEELYMNANALQTDYEGIAFDLHSNSETIKSIINDFDLFEINDNLFGSLSIQRRLDERNGKSGKARISALKRWGKDANGMPLDSERNANALKNDAIKERKGKDIKESKEINIVLSPKPKTPKSLVLKKDFEERKNDFINLLSEFKEKYASSLLNDFFGYWSEKNVKSDTMRFEDQKYFEISKRLITWKRNADKNEKN